MVKEIITDEEQLSVVCDEVDIEKGRPFLSEIIVNLKDTLNEHIDLYSLTANQIGYDKRIIVFRFRNRKTTYINPVIIKHHSGFDFCIETCSSLPGKKFLVPRYSDIEVAYQNFFGESVVNRMVGMTANKFCHCMDHLDGILSSDFGIEIDDDFISASDEEKAEIISLYVDIIKSRARTVRKDVMSDPELRKLMKNLDIRDKVLDGSIKFIGGKEVAKSKDIKNSK